MLIKFVKTDPRAGLVAEMEADRAKALIEAGAAVEVKPGAAEEHPAEAKPAKKAASKKASE